MQDRKKLAIPNVIRVDSINSVYRFSLSEASERGDIHDFYEIVYVEEGVFSVLVDGIPYEIPAGSLFVYAPNAYHVANSGGAVSAVVDIVSFDTASSAVAELGNRLLTPNEHIAAMLLSFFERARAALTSAMPLGVAPKEGVMAHTVQLLGISLEQILLCLYGECPAPLLVSGRRAYKKERFLALSSHLKRNLAARHTLATMAAASACSISTVKALCREFCGAGPIDYLISLRIERARALIREGSLNFTEIAEAVGFGTLHYFSRVFRARTGQTPTQYAAMVAK